MKVEVFYMSKSYKLKEVILYSPFENRRDRSWVQDGVFTPNKSEFVDNCFTDPCFDRKEKQLKKELEAIQEKESNERDIDNVHEKLTVIRNKRISKKNFRGQFT
jgi:hypothetical protein